MFIDRAAIPPADAAVAASMGLDAMLQGTVAKSTVIRDGNKSVTIVTDENGNTSITKNNGSMPARPGTPHEPGMPGIPGFPLGDRNLEMISKRAENISYGFFTMCAVIIVGFPLARAFGRRIDRRGTVTPLPPATTEQLQRIEQGMEAMSIEIERISESQRFMAKLQSGSSTQRV